MDMMSILYFPNDTQIENSEFPFLRKTKYW